jgi:hypothetical protein
VSPPGKDLDGVVGDVRDAMLVTNLLAIARAVPGDLLRLMLRFQGLLDPGSGESSGTDAGIAECCCRREASDASKSALSSVEETLMRRSLGETAFTCLSDADGVSRMKNIQQTTKKQGVPRNDLTPAYARNDYFA